MKALAFRSDYDYSGCDGCCGDSVVTQLCVDGKVHLEVSREVTHGETIDGWSVLGPCDGSCHQEEEELPLEVARLVQKFLATEGKKRGRIGVPRCSSGG